jgi:outer membrane protein TolC
MGQDARCWIVAVLLFAPASLLGQSPTLLYGIPSAPANVYPIDLATALQLVDRQSPTFGRAQAIAREAFARQEQAELLFIPTLSAGTTYLRHDGNTQDQRGNIFGVSRSNLFAGAGAQMRVDLADALFQPLIARQITRAETLRARAVGNNVQYEAGSAYLDLLQAHASLAINADTMARANQMLDRAKAAIEAGLSKTTGDANRAQAEVNLRQQEALDFRGRAGAASARLARVLNLDPVTELAPADPAVLPLTFVRPECSMEDLVLTAWASRPEMASQQAFVQAAREALRQSRLAPFIPKVQLDYSGGTFGGGVNQFVGNFDARGDLTASAYWELKNLGFGNRAITHQRQAVLDREHFREQEVRAQVASEVAEAARIAATRFGALAAAQEAVRQSLELYRKLLESSFGMVGPQPKYDALEPLLAIQSLNQARQLYLTQVIEFNRAQLRLFTALGQPADCGLPALPTPLDVPVAPKQSLAAPR